MDNLGGTVLVHKIEHQNAEDVILAMEKMRMEEVSGIAMVPLDEERVKREIDRFVEEFRIPVVTFTSDVEDTKPPRGCPRSRLNPQPKARCALGAPCCYPFGIESCVFSGRLFSVLVRQTCQDGGGSRHFLTDGHLCLRVHWQIQIHA